MKKNGLFFISILLIVGFPFISTVESSSITRMIQAEDRGLSYVGHLDTPGTAKSIVVQDDYAYICDTYSLRIIDVSDPSNPEEVSFNENDCSLLAIENNFLYTISSYKLNIYDLTDPKSPILLSNEWILEVVQAMDVAGDYLYAVEEVDSGMGYNYHYLRAVDVSDPTDPVIIDTVSFNNTAAGVTVAGNYAYVTKWQGTGDLGPSLRVIDISDPYNMVEVGHYDTKYRPRYVTVAGNYAYLSDYGLEIVDITDPIAPVYAGENLAFNAMSCAVAWDNAFCACGQYGVTMFDLFNIANPAIAGQYDTPGYLENVAVANGYIYATDWSNGLYILQPTFRITGVVNDLFGGAIAGVTITASGDHVATTDAGGAFTFDELPPGTYTITPSKKPYMFTPVSREVTIPPHANEIDFVGEVKIFIPLLLK